MTTVFARITEEHDCFAFSLPPCARLLYRFLLRMRPAGTPLEFELSDFQSWTGKNRYKAYCLKWIKQGLTRLRDLGLVEIVKQYSSKCFKLITYHPEHFSSNSGKKTSNFGKKTSNFGKKTSKKETSNPNDCVPSNRELREQQTEPTHHPVVVENKILEKPIILKKENSDLGSDRQSVCEKPKPETINLSEPKLEIVNLSEPKPETINLSEPEVDSSESISAPAETEPKNEINRKADDQLDQINELGVRLNPVLAKLVRMTSSEIVAKAIEAYKKYKHQKSIKNPAGFIRQAITEGWEVPEEKETPASKNRKAFKEWYESAPKSNEGLIDVPINQLPKDWNNDYMVYLAPPLGRPLGNAPYEMVKWEFARKIVTPQRE